MNPSTALLTDHYELTMIQAALASGHADRRCVFEAFARRLASVEDWAAQRSDRILLHVHEDNLRAHALYAKHGYQDTGQTSAYVLDPSRRELEMVKSLSSGR